MKPVGWILLVVLALPVFGGSRKTLKYAPLMESGAVMGELAAMVDEATRGPREAEIAAFVAIDRSGAYRLIRWRNSARSRWQSFTGALPARTIGIVHTHPNGWARPSAGDRREARRLGLPIFVVTRWEIWAAEPDGRATALVENLDWRDGLQEREMPQPTASSPETDSPSIDHPHP